jgi:hypothetical protein
MLAVSLCFIYSGCLDYQNTDLDLEYFLETGLETLESNVDYSGEDKIIDFELYLIEYTMPMVFEPELIAYFKQAEHYTKGIELFEGESVGQKLYNEFLNEDSDLYLLEGILESLRSRTIGTHYDMVQLIVAFVQSIPYEIAEEQKYPFETLYLNKGDCSDKSVLMCKLLLLEGYDACLFSYEKAEHMAVGIRVDTDDYFDGYAYVEATAYNPIGKIPEKLAGGIRIEENPDILYPISKGDLSYSEFPETAYFYGQLTQVYGEGYLSTRKNGRILMGEIHRLSSEMDSIKSVQQTKEHQIESVEFELAQTGCSGTVAEEVYETCLELTTLLNDEIAHFNSLNDELNSRVKVYNRSTKKLNQINDINDEGNELAIEFDVSSK